MKQRDASLCVMGLGALAQVGSIAFVFNPVMLIVGMLFFYVGLVGLIFGKDERVVG
jgi:hypothetical protein